MRFLTEKSHGWARAWQVIASKYDSTRCACPLTGEVWQYMSSSDQVHQFRHRSYKGERKLEDVPVQAGDFEEVPS